MRRMTLYNGYEMIVMVVTGTVIAHFTHIQQLQQELPQLFIQIKSAAVLEIYVVIAYRQDKKAQGRIGQD